MANRYEKEMIRRNIIISRTRGELKLSQVDDSFNTVLVDAHVAPRVAGEPDFSGSGYVNAKDARKSAIQWIYRKGMPGIDQMRAITMAIQKELSYADHVAYINAQKDSIARGKAIILMSKLGIDLNKLDASRRRYENRLEKEKMVQQKRREGITPKIRNAEGKTRKIELQCNKEEAGMTEGERAVKAYDEEINARRAASLPGLIGKEVQLTKEEEAELLARHNNKGRAIIK